MTHSRTILSKRFRNLIIPFISRTPSGEFLKKLAIKQWRIIACNIFFALVQALTEGATLGVIFLAVESISSGSEAGSAALANSISGVLPSAATFIESLKDKQIFLLLLLIAVVMQALQSLFKYFSLVSAGYFAARCRPIVVSRVHSQALSLDFSSASSYRVGTLTDFASQGEAAIRLQIEHLSSMLVHILMICAYLFVIVKLSPWLLLAALLVFGFLSTIQKILLPSLRSKSFQVSKIETDISSTITENFQGLRLLHTTGKLENAEKNFDNKMKKLEQSLRGQTRILSVLPAFASFFSILAIAFMMLFSVFIFEGRSVGILPNFVTFILALQRLNIRLGSTFALLDAMSDNIGRWDKLNRILSADDKEFRRTDGLQFNKLSSKIIFQSVCLSYPGESSYSLNNINFSLEKGRMIALVGPSGAGKSSIVDLLVGLYSPTKGEILVDDIPLSTIHLNSWQDRIGVVSQDTFLFNSSIADNIGFGSNSVTIAQIKEACKVSQALSFIEKLPNGLDTVIGERGYRLSGGQRQRLSLARAIIKDPEVLILDEATSSLDSTSEHLVEQAIKKLQANRTILTIAHRLSTIVRADEIIVLDKGSIVERGSHDSLLLKKNLYYQLWNSQQIG